MMIFNKSLKFVNQIIGNKPPPIPFYMLDSEKTKSFGLSDLQAPDQPKGEEIGGLQPGGKVLQSGNP
eukprot:1374002-Ditylum_brightwellii.AAC.1